MYGQSVALCEALSPYANRRKNIFAIATFFFFKQVPAGWGGGADASAYRFWTSHCVGTGAGEKDEKRITVRENIGLKNGKGVVVNEKKMVEI